MIDIATGTVSEANGTPIATDRRSAGSDGELIETVTLSDGTTALITQHAALPLDESILKPEPHQPDATTVKEATEYPGILPAEMIPFSFDTSGEDLVVEGTTPTQLADTGDLELTSITAVTPTTLSYAWVGSGDRHAIYRDGKLIQTSDSASFTESGLRAGSTYTYEVESYDDAGAIVASRFVPVTTPDGESSVAPPAVAPLTYQNYVSQAIYRTFIADARVSLGFWETWGCGQAFQPNRTFGGDNRGFVTPPFNAPWDSTSSRTSFALNINWDNPYPYDVLWVKSIGTTHLYEGSTLIESRTASDAGIVISDAYSTSSYAQARVAHDVGNPFCVAGSIQYNVVFRFYRNGTFEVVGWRYPVPHHEIYGGWDNGSGLMNWHQFGRFTNEGFGCLTGSCGTRTVNITKTY